jgi:DNA-binding NarL/FixJ family response regulator
MLTMFDDDESVLAAMRAGAKGYVLKGATQEEIVRAWPRRPQLKLQVADRTEAVIRARDAGFGGAR